MSTPSGEIFELDYEITLMNSLKVHKLWSVIDRLIETVGAVDGNTLTKIHNCVTTEKQ